MRLIAPNEGNHRTSRGLEIIVIIFWKGLCGCGSQFGLVAMFGFLVEIEFWRLKGRSFDELKIVITRKLSGQPKEGLFKVVVGLRRNIIVLKVLFAVEGNLLRLDLSVLDFYLIPSQDNGNVLTNSSQITVPVGNVLVCDTGCDIEHDDCTLSLNVVSISKTTEFLRFTEQTHK